MTPVANFGIVGREINPPFPIDGVEFGSPEIGTVGLVGRGTPHNLLSAAPFKVEEGVGGPDFNVAAAGEGHVVCAFVPEDIGICARRGCDCEDVVVVGGRLCGPVWLQCLCHVVPCSFLYGSLHNESFASPPSCMELWSRGMPEF